MTYLPNLVQGGPSGWIAELCWLGFRHFHLLPGCTWADGTGRNGWAGRTSWQNGRPSQIKDNLTELSDYRDEINSLQIQLSRTQSGPGRDVKEQVEQNSPNHIQRINLISVDVPTSTHVQQVGPLTGYEPQDLIERTLYQYVHADDMNGIRASHITRKLITRSMIYKDWDLLCKLQLECVVTGFMNALSTEVFIPYAARFWRQNFGDFSGWLVDTAATSFPSRLAYTQLPFIRDTVDFRLVCPNFFAEFWIVMSQNSASFYSSFRENVASYALKMMQRTSLSLIFFENATGLKKVSLIMCPL